VTAIRSTAAAPSPARALTPEQRRITDMLVDRILPGDELGPAALEIGAANYIDIRLAGYLAPQRDAFVAGIEALDTFAKESQGASFASLSAEKRDAVLTAISGEHAPENLRASFNQARTYTIQPAAQAADARIAMDSERTWILLFGAISISIRYQLPAGFVPGDP
jgi:Gluconate 2-dehydrogenase subunit 3